MSFHFISMWKKSSSECFSFLLLIEILPITNKLAFPDSSFGPSVARNSRDTRDRVPIASANTVLRTVQMYMVLCTILNPRNHLISVGHSPGVGLPFIA